MPVRIGGPVVGMLLLILGTGTAWPGERYGIGRPATQAEIAGWDIDVSPDGTGLPAGQGSVREGADIYAQRCAACHGAHGEGRPMSRLVGGIGTIFSARPQKTVGSFWPYATTLFDYVRRAMPLNAPQSLTADQVYAVSAYILFLNHLVPEDTVIDAATLPKIAMPNRGNFVSAWPPADRPGP